MLTCLNPAPPVGPLGRITSSFPQLVCALSAYLLTVSVEGGSVSHTRRGKSSQAKKATKRSPDGHQAAPSVSPTYVHLVPSSASCTHYNPCFLNVLSARFPCMLNICGFRATALPRPRCVGLCMKMNAQQSMSSSVPPSTRNSAPRRTGGGRGSTKHEFRGGIIVGFLDNAKGQCKNQISYFFPETSARQCRTGCVTQCTSPSVRPDMRTSVTPSPRPLTR